MTRLFASIILAFSLIFCGAAPEALALTAPQTTSAKKKKSSSSATSSKKKSGSSTSKKSGSKGSTRSSSKAAAATAPQKPMTAAEVKRAQERNATEIRETKQKITLNTRETEKRLNQLNLLEGEITDCNRRIGTLSTHIDSINLNINHANDSIAALDRRLAAISQQYVKSLRKTQGRRQQMNALAFIFSSDSFSQAYRRMRSLRQFSKWRQRRSQEINATRQQITEQRNHLAALRGDASASMGKLNGERSSLVKKQGETSVLVSRLKQEGSELKQIMERRQREAASLDAELDRIIAAEARRQEQLQRQKEEAERRAREDADRKAREAEAAQKAREAQEEAARIAAAEQRAEAEARKKAEAKAAAEREAALKKAKSDAERERIRQEAAAKAEKLAQEQARKEREAAAKAEKEKIRAEREAEQKAAREAAKNGRPVKHTGKNNNGRNSGGDDDSEQPNVTLPNTPTLPTAPVAGESGVASATAIPAGVDFDAAKGKLPFPVSGSYTIVKRFGTQQHPTLPHVTINSSGIDLATANGAAVRCVFDGEVSAVFRPDGYNNVVVIRHGRYMTVYANLGSISVSTGQKVKAGQTIGTVYTDPANDNRSILHFEIRNQRVKENPEHWLRR